MAERRGERGRDRPAPADRGAPGRPGRAHRPLRHLPDARGRRRAATRTPARTGSAASSASSRPPSTGSRSRCAGRTAKTEAGRTGSPSAAGRTGRRWRTGPSAAGTRWWPNDWAVWRLLRVRADPAARGPGRAPVPYPGPRDARRPAAHRPGRRARPDHRAGRRRAGSPACRSSSASWTPAWTACARPGPPTASWPGWTGTASSCTCGRPWTHRSPSSDQVIRSLAPRTEALGLEQVLVQFRDAQSPRADAAAVPPAGRRADAAHHRPAARSAARAERLHAERDQGPPPRHRIPVRAHPADHPLAGPGGSPRHVHRVRPGRRRAPRCRWTGSPG